MIKLNLVKLTLKHGKYKHELDQVRLTLTLNASHGRIIPMLIQQRIPTQILLALSLYICRKVSRLGKRLNVQAGREAKKNSSVKAKTKSSYVCAYRQLRGKD